MVDDERWRDELLRALGREPTRDDLLAIEAAVAANQHRRAAVRLADRELLRLSEAQLAEALALLGLTEPH